MKLTEVAANLAPPGTIRYFQRSQQRYAVNQDGSIDIDQDFEVEGHTPLDFPKINHVNGDFLMRLPKGRVWQEVMPNTVAGHCKIIVGMNEVIKSSQLPKCSTGSGEVVLSGDGHLEIDDDTLFTYKTQKFDLWISKGLEHLPRHIETPALRVITGESGIEGIPPSIKAISLLIKSEDPSTLKGLHKRCKSLSLDMLILQMPYDTPLLGILKFPGIKMIHFSVSNGYYTDAQSMQLNNMINRAITDKQDIFEAQEAMIDAGFARNAKL